MKISDLSQPSQAICGIHASPFPCCLFPVEVSAVGDGEAYPDKLNSPDDTVHRPSPNAHILKKSEHCLCEMECTVQIRMFAGARNDRL